jgi:hypothetical protein
VGGGSLAEGLGRRVFPAPAGQDREEDQGHDDPRAGEGVGEVELPGWTGGGDGGAWVGGNLVERE